LQKIGIFGCFLVFFAQFLAVLLPKYCQSGTANLGQNTYWVVVVCLYIANGLEIIKKQRFFLVKYLCVLD